VPISVAFTPARDIQWQGRLVRNFYLHTIQNP